MASSSSSSPAVKKKSFLSPLRFPLCNQCRKHRKVLLLSFLFSLIPSFFQSPCSTPIKFRAFLDIPELACAFSTKHLGAFCESVSSARAPRSGERTSRDCALRSKARVKVSFFSSFFLLFIVYCLLFIVYCLLFIVHCLLFIVYCLLFLFLTDFQQR